MPVVEAAAAGASLRGPMDPADSTADPSPVWCVTERKGGRGRGEAKKWVANRRWVRGEGGRRKGANGWTVSLGPGAR